MHIKNYIYLSIKRLSLYHCFVPYLSSFSSCMTFQSRCSAPILLGFNSLSDLSNCGPPSRFPGTAANAYCLLIDLFKRLLNTLLLGLIKPSSKYRCCATSDLVNWGSVRRYRLLKAPTQKTYPERVLAWRLLDEYCAAIILFFSPFKRYLPSSHTDVPVLKHNHPRKG